MKQDMDLIELWKSTWKPQEEESVPIENAKLQSLEYLVASKFNAGVAKHACASNVLKIKWNLTQLHRKPTIIWTKFMEESFDYKILYLIKLFKKIIYIHYLNRYNYFYLCLFSEYFSIFLFLSSFSDCKLLWWINFVWISFVILNIVNININFNRDFWAVLSYVKENLITS